MKSLLVLLLGISSTLANASEFRFSAYSCHFQRIVKDNMWFPPMMGYGNYNNILGWNQTTHITKSTSKTETSELGICGSIHSTVPEYIRLSIHYVNGKDLEMNAEGCMYSGKDVAFESVSKEVTSIDDYLIARKTLTTEYGDVEFVTVVGVREKFEDFPHEQCMRAFEEVTGTKYTASKKNSVLKSVHKKMQGHVLSHL